MLPPDLYLRVREKEQRLYADNVVAALPDITPDHPLSAEWRARRRSLERLAAYLKDSAAQQPARLLELGCGNGWLSHRLSAVPAWQIIGLDRLGPELRQAARLFPAQRLSFLATDIFKPPFEEAAFNIIVVASAIQYFSDLPGLIRSLGRLLKTDGELHLLDSPLYDADEVPAARKRTDDYYAALGFPEMAAHYFHHTFAELRPFAPRWLYRPSAAPARLRAALGRPDSPFPWFAIGRNASGN